jgi:hypothetical protein
MRKKRQVALCRELRSANESLPLGKFKQVAKASPQILYPYNFRWIKKILFKLQENLEEY